MHGGDQSLVSFSVYQRLLLKSQSQTRAPEGWDCLITSAKMLTQWLDAEFEPYTQPPVH